MKKAMSITAILLAMFLLVSCAAEESPEVEEPFILELVTYNSLDEFLAAAETASAAKSDIAELAALDEIKLPTAIPESYKLYKITAGAADIAFWYLPEEYLTDSNTIFEAETYLKYYKYIDSRNTEFDDFTRDLDRFPYEVVNGKYYILNTTSCMINWEEDGRLLSLYLPADMEVSDGKIVSANDAATASANKTVPISISLDNLCQTEEIVIDRTDAVE